MARTDSDKTVKHLQSEHCDVNDNFCLGMISEITPIMVTILSTWMMENQTNICEFEIQDPVLNAQCGQCNGELGLKIDQIYQDTLLSQRTRLFGRVIKTFIMSKINSLFR